MRPGSDQARFKFAKDTIEVRKRTNPRAAGAEETVVLAFGGGGGGSAVHVARKLRKKPLWKVNRWMDRFEDWREERLKGAFRPILRHANAGSDI